MYLKSNLVKIAQVIVFIAAPNIIWLVPVSFADPNIYVQVLILLCISNIVLNVFRDEERFQPLFMKLDLETWERE